MLIAAITIGFSVVSWAVKALAAETESHHQSVTDLLPHYPRPNRKS